MADISDVESGLVAAIAQLIYPNGTGQPSINGAPTVVYAGWPQSSQLDADLAGFANGKGGRVHVTVFAGGAESNTTRYSTDLQAQSASPPTLALTIAGLTITVGGTVSTPQNVALIVNGLAYAYAVQPADTLTSVATALASQVPGATNAGAVITLAAGARISAARSGGSATATRELRRQKKVVQLTVWADTPARRDTTAAAIDVVFAGTEFLTLPDGSSARMIYQQSRNDDSTQKSNLYRRDLMYSVEYATIQTVTATTIIVGQENMHSGVTGNAADLNTTTIYE